MEENACSSGTIPDGICDGDNTEQCVRDAGSYRCVCKPGFSGDKCQNNDNDIDREQQESSKERLKSMGKSDVSLTSSFI